MLGCHVICHTVLMSDRGSEKQRRLPRGESWVSHAGLPDPKSYAFSSRPGHSHVSAIVGCHVSTPPSRTQHLPGNVKPHAQPGTCWTPCARVLATPHPVLLLLTVPTEHLHSTTSPIGGPQPGSTPCAAAWAPQGSCLLTHPSPAAPLGTSVHPQSKPTSLPRSWTFTGKVLPSGSLN